MLAWLSIQGLALVESVELDFAAGLNVLTGETGAGKSLVLGAVGLLLGERADQAWLRSGESRGAVEGTFDLSRRPDLVDALRARDVDVEEGRVVLRRELIREESEDVKSRAFVNGRGVPAARLREIGDLLVDLHGQHEHQQLLHTDRQTDFFDRWAGTWDDRRRLEGDRARLLEERRALEAARSTHERDRSEEESLRADLAELIEAAVTPEEEAALLRERERLAHRERLLSGMSEGLGALAGEDDGAESRLRRALKALRQAAALDPGLAPLASEAEEAAEAVAAVSSRLEAERERLLESETLDLDVIESRLDRFHRLKRKHRTDAAGLAALRAELEVRVRALEPGSDALSRLDCAYRDHLAAYDLALERLASGRSSRAASFQRDAGALLERLGFGAAALMAAPSETEADRGRPAIDPVPIPALEFTFRPNAGEPARPLRRIASGGELSRVMLAVKSLMAERDQVALLVFDEVDQGIGGAVGEEVGRLLRALGQRRQVICITHLPLIAAQAQRQFRVSKTARGGRTAVTVSALGDEGRVEEIARLLAGARATETTARQARELLMAAERRGTGAARPPAAPRRAAGGGR